MPGSPDRSDVRSSFLGDGPSRLYVRAVGHGPPIVILHGGPDFDHEYLLPDLDRLADGFRLVYYDQRGRGRSFFGQRPEDVSIGSEIEDLDRIVTVAGDGPVVLLGHSWGGLLAAEYAVRHPDRVSHLILLDTAPLSHSGMLELRRSLAARRTPAQETRRAELLTDPLYLSGDIEADADYYRIHFANAFRRPDLLERVIRRLRVGFTSEGIVAARRIEERLYSNTWSDPDYDLAPALGRSGVPSLLIHGDHDIVPFDVVQEIARAIPGARLAVLEECGHFAYLEQPERMRSTITEFLAPG
jgi:proline iminopeptidase